MRRKIKTVKINCNEIGQFLNIQIVAASFDNWDTEIHEYDIDETKNIHLQIRKAIHDYRQMVLKRMSPKYEMKPYDGYTTVERSALWCLMQPEIE
jgi:hypothetical protein